MAALSGSAPADIDGSRDTLLNIVLGEVQKAGKAVILGRVLVVARLNRREYTAENITAYFGRVFETHQNDIDITGFSVVYPFCACIMIEATMSVIASLLKDIVEADQNESRIQEAKVVASTEDISSRWFKSWQTTYIQSNASSEPAAPSSDCAMAVKLASEINISLLKLSKQLSTLPDAEVRKQMQALNNYYDDLPSAENLLLLLSAEDAPCIREYLDLFHSNVNTDLDGEKVWPVPPPLCI